MQEVSYNKYSANIMNLIKDGAFLTTMEDNGKVNTMTIGWGHIGVVWRKPVMIAYVRHSRLTHSNVEKNGEFSVSFPFEDMKQSLLFCGTKSGRAFDKLKECNLKTIPSKYIKAPIIDCKGIHYECKVLYKQEMDKDLFLDKKIVKDCYSDNDLHTIYYAEILAAYENL